MRLVLNHDPESGMNFTDAARDKFGCRYMAKKYPDSHRVFDVPDETAQRWNETRSAWYRAQVEMARVFYGLTDSSGASHE